MAPTLSAWVNLSLRETLDAATLVERMRALGVHADLTRDGIALPWGFLGWLERSPSAGLLDLALHEGAPDLGAVCLCISGGTNELARNAHREPEVTRAATRRLRNDLAAVTRQPGAPPPTIESAASKKMLDLTRLVRALGPLVGTIEIPRANHIARGAADFLREAESYVDGSAYTFPLWTFLKPRNDEGGGHLASTGMWTFGLPDVGAPLVDGLAASKLVAAVGALQREMVAEGWWPEDGQTFVANGIELSIERVWDAIWVVPRAHASVPTVAAARGRFVRQTTMAQILGDATHFHRTADAGRVAIEHFLRRGGSSHIAITNGLSSVCQPGGNAADQNDFVELSLTSTSLGPWANGWLDWAASCLHAHQGAHPIRPYDRLVLPEPDRGIAGVIVYTSGDLRSPRPGEPAARLWDLIPITPDELARFRSDPGAQKAWLAERDARADFASLQERWSACAGR